MGKNLDIADRLESASFNGISRTLSSTQCRQAAEVIRGLRTALQPFADISLVRDTDQPDKPDMIEGPDLAITPDDVRRARAALESK